MRTLSADIADLVMELEVVLELLDVDNLSEALDELELQRGTIDTILTKAGRPEINFDIEAAKCVKGSV